MREVLFRGKRLDNGGWVFGDLLLRKTKSRGVVTVLAEIYTLTMLYVVDPETVWQYTGEKDKDGAPIFEGDIIKTTTLDTEEDRFSVVKFGKFYDVNADENYLGFYIESHVGSEVWQLSIFNGETIGYSLPDYAEVIGNIHDNPDLLEVKK